MTTNRFALLKNLIAFTVMVTCVAVTHAREAKPIDISMIELIATGGDFDGKRITVIGVPSVGFEASHLYQSYESFRISDTTSSVVLRLSKVLQEEVGKLNGSSSTLRVSTPILNDVLWPKMNFT